MTPVAVQSASQTPARPARPAGPIMPTAAKHKRALKPFVDDGGKVHAAAVHPHTALIPAGDCRAVIGELEAALGGCADAPALVFAKQLIGAYRIKDVVDAKVYVATMAAKFQKFPPDICARIVDHVTDRLKFPPAPADVVEAGETFVRERHAALWTARQHAAEHQRRQGEAARRAALDAERAGRAEQLEAAYANAGLDWPGRDKASWVAVAKAGMTLPDAQQAPKQEKEPD